MKIIYNFLIFVILITGCSGRRYLLVDKGTDKQFLLEAIQSACKTGEISKKPMIVVDGVPYRYNKELKKSRLQLEKRDIKKIDIVKKDVAIRIYGSEGESGLLLITTKSAASTNTQSMDRSKVLILLNDKAISRAEMDRIIPDDIESIEVIKDKEKVKKYTSEDYDGVVIIHMKRKE